MSWIQVSTTPTGRIYGCLYSAISRPPTKSQFASHEGLPFENQSMKSATVKHISPLAALNWRSQCCRLTDYVPPGMVPLERLPEIYVTVSSGMPSEESSRGWIGYESSMAAVGEGGNAWSTAPPSPSLYSVCSFLRLNRALLIFLCNPPHHRLHLTLEHYDVIYIIPVLLRLLSTGRSVVLIACPQCLFHQHTMPPCLP